MEFDTVEFARLEEIGTERNDFNFHGSSGMISDNSQGGRDGDTYSRPENDTSLNSNMLQDVAVDESQLSAYVPGLDAVYFTNGGSSVSSHVRNTESLLSGRRNNLNLGDSIISSVFFNDGQDHRDLDEDSEQSLQNADGVFEEMGGEESDSLLQEENSSTRLSTDELFGDEETSSNNYHSFSVESEAVNEYAKKLLKYEEMIRKLEEERSELLAQNMRLTQKSNEPKTENLADNAAAEVSTLRARIYEEEQRRTLIDTELSALKQSLFTKNETNAELFTELANVKNEFTNEKLARARAEKVVEELQATHKETREFNRHLSEEVDRLKIELAEGHEKMETQRVQLNTMRIALEDKESGESKDGEIERLELELLHSRQNKVTLEDKVQLLEKKCADIEPEVLTVEELRIDRRRMESELGELRNELDRQSQTVRELRENLVEAEEGTQRWCVMATEKEEQIAGMAAALKSELSTGREEEAFLQRLAEKLETKPVKASPLVIELTDRIDSLVTERSRFQSTINSLQSELAAKDALLKQYKESPVVATTEHSQEDMPQLLQKLAAENSMLRTERDELDAQLQKDQSFTSPSFRIEENSSADVSFEKALSSAEELVQRSQTLASKLEDLARAGQSDNIEGTIYRELYALIISQDEVIKGLQQRSAKHEEENAIALLQAHVDQLQQMWQHEARANEELRSLLEEAEQNYKARMEQSQSDLQKLKMSMATMVEKDGRINAWMQSLVAELTGKKLQGSNEEEMKSGLADACQIQAELRCNLFNAQRRMTAFERTAAMLKFQKSLVLNIYAARGELPPGVAWSDEKCTSAGGKLRASLRAVLAIVRMKGSTSDESLLAVNVSDHMNMSIPSARWNISGRNATAPRLLQLIVPKMEGALAEKDRRIAQLEVAAKTAVVHNSHNGNEVSTQKELAKLSDEKRTLTIFFEREISEALRQREELATKLKSVEKGLEDAKTRAAVEREARKVAQAKVRKYVLRLEEYSSALQKVRAESESRKRSVKAAIAQLHARLDEAHSMAKTTNWLQEVEESLDQIDKENLENSATEPGPLPPKVTTSKNDIITELKERQRRANKLLLTLTKSAQKDLDRARSQSGEDGAKIADQLEEYISGLKTTSNKLKSTRIGQTPLASVSNTFH